MGRAKGFSFYTEVDLPECGLTVLFVTVQHVKDGVYKIWWAQELDEQLEMSMKDRGAADRLAIEAAKSRIAARAPRYPVPTSI